MVGSIATPPSPPSGPMTRAQAKALHDKVNSLLATCEFGSTLDGVLLHSDTLCILRYEPRQPASSEQGVAVKTGQNWSFMAGVSAVHQPESPPPPESPPNADRSLCPSHLSLEATACDNSLCSRSETAQRPTGYSRAYHATGVSGVRRPDTPA